MMAFSTMAMAIRCALLLLLTQSSAEAFAPLLNHVRMFATNLLSESAKSFDEIAYETDRLSKDAKAMDVSAYYY